jgi:hypothetical protein
LLGDLSESLRNAVSASADLAATVQAMSRVELDAAYAELDQLRTGTMDAIEAIMIRRRAVAAADRLGAELGASTPSERAGLQALLDEHAELVASLR